jgi:hypothetical protein
MQNLDHFLQIPMIIVYVVEVEMKFNATNVINNFTSNALAIKVLNLCALLASYTLWIHCLYQ